MALPYSSRGGAQILWVVLHTAEGSRTRASLYNYFNTVRAGSSHGGADGTGLDDGWVPDQYAAWTLLNGNNRSLNLEMCGFARWTREQWLSTGTVDGVYNPRQMVRNAAEWARRKCEKYGIPKVHIGPQGVAAGRKGVIMHRDYTYGARDGDHTDIGNNFPWDVFWADMGQAKEEIDVDLNDVVGRRPDGSNFTVRDCLANNYMWTFYHGPSGPAGGKLSATEILTAIHEAVKPIPVETSAPDSKGVAPKIGVPVNVAAANVYGQTFFGSNYGFGDSVLNRLDRIENAVEALLSRLEGEAQTPPQAPAPVVEKVYHTVVKGDTYYRIAETYGVQVSDLVELNPEVDVNALEIGSKVRVK